MSQIHKTWEVTAEQFSFSSLFFNENLVCGLGNKQQLFAALHIKLKRNVNDLTMSPSLTKLK